MSGSRGRSEGDFRALVVEDDLTIGTAVIDQLAESGLPARLSHSIEEARALLAAKDFELLVVDAEFSGGDGMGLLMDAGVTDRSTAVIVLSTDGDAKAASRAFDRGAFGYVVKPFVAAELAIAILAARKRRENEMLQKNALARLEEMVRARSGDAWNYVYQLEQAERELKSLQEETIRRLSIAAEFRDDETPRHIERMTRYCALLAERLGEAPERCELIRTASALHDVGKIAIPDQILMKPGPLDEDEWHVMKRHCVIGHRILSGSTTGLLSLAAEIALTHHERVDGNGYPNGLRGDEIPLAGRIAAVADVFDALTSDKVYRKALPISQAVEIMKEGRGTQFDSDILDAFLAERARILGIKERYADLPHREEANELSALVAEG